MFYANDELREYFTKGSLEHTIANELKKVSLEKEFQGMKPHEREERARRVDYVLQYEAELLRIDDDNKEVLHICALNLYYCTSICVNMVKFCRVAAAVRDNLWDWNQYVAYPMQGLPPSLKAYADEKAIIYCLAALGKHGIIQLHPSESFVESHGRHDDDETYVSTESILSELDLKELFTLWDSLGRPHVRYLGDIRRSHDTTEAFLSDNIANKVRFKNHNKGFYYHYQDGSEPIRFDLCINNCFCENMYRLRINPRAPIQCNEEHLYALDFNLERLVMEVSYVMAFDPISDYSTGKDILSIIKKLLPLNTEIIPDIIKSYYLSSTAEPLEETAQIAALRKVHREAFGCEILHENISNKHTPLHHRGALKQIWETPELFIDWAEDSNMHHLYYDLVEPALRDKYGSVSNYKLERLRL